MRVQLITEGITDQHVLVPIVKSFWPDLDIDFVRTPSSTDKTDKQDGWGGWQLVLQKLESLDVAELIQYNDLVVVQIDTDVSPMTGFDVPHWDGEKLSPETLIEKVIQRLKFCLHPSPTEDQEKFFIFAIGVHTLECWLVGLRDSQHKATKINDCLKHLNTALLKKKEETISPNDKNNRKSQKVYEKLGNELAKPKVLKTQAPLNVGLQSFLAQLAAFKAAHAAS
jgi:hypothetical protein